jgi:FMN reductase
MFSAAELDLPFYDPKSPDRTGKALEFIGALRASDGIIVASPGYHGALSGMIKNALDYVEDMAGDTRAYPTRTGPPWWPARKSSRGASVWTPRRRAGCA